MTVSQDHWADDTERALLPLFLLTFEYSDYENRWKNNKPTQPPYSLRLEYKDDQIRLTSHKNDFNVPIHKVTYDNFQEITKEIIEKDLRGFMKEHLKK